MVLLWMMIYRGTPRFGNLQILRRVIMGLQTVNNHATDWWASSFTQNATSDSFTNWWFQLPWKILLVGLDHHPDYWGK